MKLQDILEGIGIRSFHADPEMEISGIAYDSRTVEPGQLFVAVTGFAADSSAS